MPIYLALEMMMNLIYLYFKFNKEINLLAFSNKYITGQ